MCQMRTEVGMVMRSHQSIDAITGEAMSHTNHQFEQPRGTKGRQSLRPKAERTGYDIAGEKLLYYCKLYPHE